MKDLKEALSSTRKADTTHVRHATQVYIARPCEWGSVKYQRANFLRPASDSPDPVVRTRADFERMRTYLRAARDHIDAALDSMELHQATDPRLGDVEGMRRAAYAVDLDAKPGDAHGASYLPHVAPAAASLNMAIAQATHFGLLPADPGQPWKDGIVEGWATEGAMPRMRPFTGNAVAIAEVPRDARPMSEPAGPVKPACTARPDASTSLDTSCWGPCVNNGEDGHDWHADGRGHGWRNIDAPDVSRADVEQRPVEDAIEALYAKWLDERDGRRRL